MYPLRAFPINVDISKTHRSQYYVIVSDLADGVGSLEHIFSLTFCNLPSTFSHASEKMLLGKTLF